MKINGIEVQDANEKLTVKITKADVRKGSLKDASACAAANALCRQEHCDEARVHFSRAYIRKGKKWLRFGVPLALRNEILAFDRPCSQSSVSMPHRASATTTAPTRPATRTAARRSSGPTTWQWASELG